MNENNGKVNVKMTDLTRKQLDQIEMYTGMWLSVLGNIGLPSGYDLDIETCVDDGFPGFVHNQNLTFEGEPSDDSELIQRISDAQVFYAHHHQVAPEGWNKYVLDLDNIAAVDRDSISSDNSVEELAKGRVQIMVSPDNSTIVTGIPGDAYASHVDGTGPAFGVPYSRENGVG
ncbi:hypothetical protein JXC34_00060 [Candidatus Woesearchaeota archaeon]|nr:hypothetical protein [Candidatus Woesearchaeota archaeon]